LSMGMSFLWESHGKRPMGWDRHKLLWDGNGTDEYVPWTTLEMKHTSQHCCDKTMDGKMALYRECCFTNCTKSWWKKLLS